MHIKRIRSEDLLELDNLHTKSSEWVQIEGSTLMSKLPQATSHQCQHMLWASLEEVNTVKTVPMRLSLSRVRHDKLLISSLVSKLGSIMITSL